jgi:alanine racemase
MADSITKERSWVEIDLSAFRANLQALKKLMRKDQSFIQIVKADAYGHGAAEISAIALAEGAQALGVANLEEGKLLRVQGITAPIIILSPSLPSEIAEIIRNNLTSTVNDLSFAKELNDLAAEQDTKVTVHLKYDSGMHRSGALEEEFAALWVFCSKAMNIQVEGVFSHFAASESDVDFSLSQQQDFQRVLKKHKIEPPWIHMANSSALVNGLGSFGNLCRLGILSYGVYTHPSQRDMIKLKPVMTFKSTLSQIKTITKGSFVGYNLTWQARRATRYAVIPVGYADGYDFLLSNKGFVSIKDRLCPVIGKVSMDMICVDVTDISDAKTGDEVILLGGNKEELRAENLTSLYQGSAYELLCQVGRRARRFYYKNGKLITSSPLLRREFVSTDYSDAKLSQIIQSAISQRINSDEMAELISREILRVFFFNKDRKILYRRDFMHRISFSASDDPDYWKVKTQLSFRKVLQNDFFTVACASSERALTDYFKRQDVEYRWLMDGKFDLSPDAFKLSSVFINDVILDTTIQLTKSCLEIQCSHPDLKQLVGSEVTFLIDTETLYPRSSHQLSVFITELTQGVKIIFQHPEDLQPIEVVPVFSGQNKYPVLRHTNKEIRVSTNPDEWVFPQSGVIFAY